MTAQARTICLLSDGQDTVIRSSHLEQIAKQAAEIALRLAALPADGLRNNFEALDSIEQLAIRILTEVSALRAAQRKPVGETSGAWRAIAPLPRQ